MNGGWTPVFSTVFTGTLCGKYPDTAAWMFFLALADKNGVVDMTPQAISALTGMPVDVLMPCIERFEQPDPYSRTSDEDGRRLVRIDPARPWGWRVVNHSKYRERARKQAWDAERTASGRDAERKRLQRADVPTCPDVARLSPLSDTDTNTNTDPREERFAPPPGLDQKAFERWESYRASGGRPLAPASVFASQRKLAAYGAEQARVVEHSIANGWWGLYAPKDKEPAKRWDPRDDPEYAETA